MRRPTIFVLLLLTAAALAGQARAATCRSGYSYSGFDSARLGHGVTAKLTPLADPQVARGHVAGWVGLGGWEAGPGGTPEWIQVGLNGWVGTTTSHMYYEVTRAREEPEVVELKNAVAIGETHKVAVLEMAHRRAWWRVWVDGSAVSEPIYLPGSHGTWYPEAIGESWNENTKLCNGYSYRFDRIRIATRPGGRWRAIPRGFAYHDEGYGLVNNVAGSFTALTTAG